ncbi:MAG TPA: helix-turn-helix transcriptional regulator, partial [Acetobacteraceae bacterium]|nr:helix-turn-helix transcriptional regulator [Acetobacteraceae bacterium]
GMVALLTTAPGQFRARLAQLELHRLRLTVASEHLPRIAAMAAPAGTLLVSWPSRCGPAQVWGGVTLRAGEIVTTGPGRLVQIRTSGPCRWCRISLPAAELGGYGRALKGAAFAVPHAMRCWRVPPAPFRRLSQLHEAAVRMTEERMEAGMDAATAHGLEQQVIHALVDCLSGPADVAPAAEERHQEIIADFAALVLARWRTDLPIGEICGELGISARLLRLCCERHLGMSPACYVRLWRMHRVRRALQGADPGSTGVAETARRYGFGDHGRFSGNYRALFGELPSCTLRTPGLAASRVGRPGRRA